MNRNIIKCVQNGDISGLKRIISSNSKTNFPNSKTKSKSEVEVIDFIDVCRTQSGDTVASLAARYGQLDVLKFIYVQTPGAVELANLDGKRPLHEAAQHGQLACVSFLLLCGVDVDTLKRADWTPLMLACTKTNLAVIKELVHAGSRPVLRNKDGWNTLHIACRVGKREVIELLLGRDRDLWKTRSNNGRTPLHTAALHGRLEACEVLLQRGGYKVDDTDNCGTTPLMDALRSGHTDIAHLLVAQHKADTAKEDKLGRQCLHLAAEAGSTTSVVYLSQRSDFNVNVQTLTSGVTPLHLAAKEGHQGMIHLLVSLGADVHCKDNNGRTALDLAHSSQQEACVGLLSHSPLQ